jgi:hypothetical protein
MANVDEPLRAHGGVEGFGIEFPGPIKTSKKANGHMRITPVPALPKISTVEIWIGGNLQQQIPIAGEWQVLFKP